MAVTQYWFRATNAADTPVLQLKLYKDLLVLQRRYPASVDAVITRLQKHLYFLCEEMTPLALASDLLDDAQRSSLAKVLEKKKREEEEEVEEEEEEEEGKKKKKKRGKRRGEI